MRSEARTHVEEAPFKSEASKQTIKLWTTIRLDQLGPELHCPSSCKADLSDSACVIAFNSPFLINYDGTSISFNTSIENLCLVWVKEIRRRQPQGPYIIGGYSAGGYYAFEVAKQLRHEGEKVEKLVLIDSPCRVEFGAPQTEAIQFLSDHGMLGDWGAAKKTPDWFVRHFQGTIEAVERYTPKIMGGERETNATEMPECFVIWATKGILEEIDIEPSEMGLDLSAKITKFMLEGKRETDLACMAGIESCREP